MSSVFRCLCFVQFEIVQVINKPYNQKTLPKKYETEIGILTNPR